MELSGEYPTGRDEEIVGISTYSKQVKEGFAFVAVPGTRFNGCDFIGEAISRGARAIIHSTSYPQIHELRRKGVLFIKVRDVYRALAQVAANFYGHPSSKIKIVGITGTNGKTTTAYLIESMVKAAGFKVGVISTVNYRFGQRVIPATNTTPGPIQLQELLHNMRADGVDYTVMEVSSHGLKQRRVEGIDFAAGIFTNITIDHLDYHKTFENYFNAKSILFRNLSPHSWAIINMDDPHGKELLSRTDANSITYGIDATADVEAHNILNEVNGSRFFVSTPHGKIELKTALIGRHNVYNILAAVSFGISQNLDLRLIKQGLEALDYIPGRLELIDAGQPFKVFVDYAHTDDALRKIISSIRPICGGKIIIVFGCGGDRCRDKRPLMGKVAAELTDYVILTTDNPRSEEPEAIIKEIEVGFPGGFANYQVILDRYAAINEAIRRAKEDDAVIIAGKGHEAYQVFKNTSVPFDDRFIVKEILLENKLLPCKEVNTCNTQAGADVEN